MAAPVANLIQSTAASYGVDPSLALAVATEESGLNQNAIGSAGEIGVMQLMPATAAALGVDPTNLQQNISGGIKFLAQLIQQFGDAQEAVAAYNAGPNAVMTAIVRGGQNWLAYMPASTQQYVATIFSSLGIPLESQAQPAAAAPVIDVGPTDPTDVTSETDAIPYFAPVAPTSSLLPWALGAAVGFFILWNLVEA